MYGTNHPVEQPDAHPVLVRPIPAVQGIVVLGPESPGPQARAGLADLNMATLRRQCGLQCHQRVRIGEFRPG